MYRSVYSDNNKGPIRCMGCNNYIYSKVGQGFMAISKQTLSILRLCLQTQSVYCLLPLILACAMTMNQCPWGMVPSILYCTHVMIIFAWLLALSQYFLDWSSFFFHQLSWLKSFDLNRRAQLLTTLPSQFWKCLSLSFLFSRTITSYTGPVAYFNHPVCK